MTVPETRIVGLSFFQVQAARQAGAEVTKTTATFPTDPATAINHTLAAKHEEQAQLRAAGRKAIVPHFDSVIRKLVAAVKEEDSK